MTDIGFWNVIAATVLVSFVFTLAQIQNWSHFGHRERPWDIVLLTALRN